MEHWWLYLLVFVFGYLTHKTFYFVRSSRISIGLIRMSQLISLGILARSMENFYYAHTARLRQLKENNESAAVIKDTRRSFNMEISTYKEKAIKEMIESHPKFYAPIVNFTDWKSAMKYLETHRSVVTHLLDSRSDD